MNLPQTLEKDRLVTQEVMEQLQSAWRGATTASERIGAVLNFAARAEVDGRETAKVDQLVDVLLDELHQFASASEEMQNPLAQTVNDLVLQKFTECRTPKSKRGLTSEITELLGLPSMFADGPFSERCVTFKTLDTAKSRNQYPQAVKDLVLLKYPRCRTIEDKWALAYEVADLMGIPKDDPNLLQKLYNLASRIKATRRHRTTAEEWTSEDELRYDPSTDAARLEIRDDPETLEWTKSDERYLRQNWKIYKIEDIAFQLNRSETAVAYRALQLGLRQVPKYYDATKVGPWLGLTQKDMINLQEKGLELKPCTDYRGEYKLTLISTASLYRLLRNEKLRTFLIQNRRADRFFIMDVIESMEGVIATHTKRVLEQKKAQGKKLTGDEQEQLTAAKAKIREVGRELDFEINDWVSHGHTCLCPYSEYTFGTRFDGTDTETTGYELKPDELHPDKQVGTESWRREYWGGRKQIAA